MVTTEDFMKLTLSAIDDALAQIHTQTIAKVTKVRTSTIDLQCVFKYKQPDDVEINYPLFTDVPLILMLGGGSSIQMPIAIGDYCIVSFTERCFDNWYYGNDSAVPLEYRMHDLSDGFATCGVLPSPSALAIPSVITQTGDTYYEGNHIQDGTMTRTGDTVIVGNLRVTGTTSSSNFTGLSGADMTSTTDIISSGVSLQSHTHSGVETGSGNTGEPN